MITRKELERLAEIESDQGILSTYVPVDPKRMYDRRHPAAEFKNALRRFEERTHDARWLSVAEREKHKVLKFFESWKPRGRGLVIFSSQPASIWEVVSLDVSVNSLVDVDTTTRTGMLARILDEYPRFVVAVVQSDRARIYIAEQRRAAEEAEIESEVPGRHDQGGWAQARFQRHIEFHIESHLKKVVEELEGLYYHKPYNWLALGGSEEAVNELTKMLPAPVARRVIGTFPVDLKHDTEEELLERARSVREEDERRSEKELVDKVISASASGGQGVVGLDETLRAVVEGRVRTLVLVDSLRQSGSVCTKCRFLAAKPRPRCPVCEAPMDPTTDVVERAVERVFLSGAHVEVVFGQARDRLMERGGMGAVLRY